MSNYGWSENEVLCWNAAFHLMILLIKFDLKSAHDIDRSLDYNIDAYMTRVWRSE